MQTAGSHELQAIIQEVQIIPIKPTNGIVGFASFVLNHSLYMGSIAIVSRPNGGFRLLYPTKKVGDSNIDIFHPINRVFAEQIECAVIAKYEDVMNKGNRNGSVPS